jgi:hypothetical protein
MSFPPEDWTQWFIALGGILFVFAVWISLFTAGTLVDSEPYRRVISPQGVEEARTNGAPSEQDSLARTRLSGDTTSFQSGRSAASSSDSTGPALLAAAEPPTDSTLWAFLVVLFCFTPPNLAFLCIFAGVLGAMGRRLVLSTRQNHATLDHTYPLLSALLRSFFVYLTVISGLLVLLENPILGTASPGQYVRFAGLLSLLSFFVSYDPTMFVALLDRVRDRVQEKTEADESEDGNGRGTTSRE